MKDKHKKHKKHPATFSKPILGVINDVLCRHGADIDVPRRLIDPFVGVGGVAGVDWEGEKYGVEIEAEWAKQAAEKGITTHVGNSRKLPWPDEYFGIICTSPAYGNRLADGYAPDMTDPKNKHRCSYRIDLERPLTRGSGSALKWGDKYRALHAEVWRECVRVLHQNGLFILNVKDHYKKRKRDKESQLQEVAKWHLGTLLGMGMELVAEVKVPAKGDRNTAAMRAQGKSTVDFEWVFVLRKRNPYIG